MERSIALAPTEAVYHRNICEVYRVLGRFDEALVAGRRAAALAPDDLHCHHNLGVLHYHRLELDEAIASGERAMALDPDFAGRPFRDRRGLAAARRFRARLGGIRVALQARQRRRRCCRRPSGRNGTAARSATGPCC